MKTKIIIEIETNKFTTINSEEDLSGEDITDDIEKEFHSAIFRELLTLEEKDGSLYNALSEGIFENTEELNIEGLECLGDFAKELNFKVSIEEKNE